MTSIYDVSKQLFRRYNYSGIIWRTQLGTDRLISLLFGISLSHFVLGIYSMQNKSKVFYKTKSILSSVRPTILLILHTECDHNETLTMH